MKLSFATAQSAEIAHIAVKIGKEKTAKRMGLAKGFGCQKRPGKSNLKRKVITDRKCIITKVNPHTPTVLLCLTKLYLGNMVRRGPIMSAVPIRVAPDNAKLRNNEPPNSPGIRKKY